MQVLYSANLSSSCKKCIDDNNFFCQNAVGSAGVCCQESVGCTEVDVCSYHAPVDSTGLKYWACPHSLETCGVENLYVPSDDGSASTLRPKGNYSTEFTRNSMCRYRLVFPAAAGEFDQIRFFLQSEENVQVYLIETSTYKSTNFEE